MHMSAVFAGIDVNGLLVRVTAAAGMLGPAIREDEDVFSERRLTLWSQRFPFRYGMDEKAFNLFLTSTEGLGMTSLPPRAVLLASADLQYWPPNLIRIGDEFAGQSRRLAAAPSATWLQAARTKALVDRRAIAWISTEASEVGGATLQSMVDRLAQPLQAHGIILDTGSEIPTNMQGAELVIVGAHGSLVPGSRYFQLIQNDADLRVASSTLSEALRGAGVVILFVCSGGRLDPHPLANTTIGLARQILGNGCAAVIASPWPLDSRLPSYWLPAFLKAWDTGLPIIDAAFEANVHVRDRFSSEFRDCLAMTVYGDPLRTKVMGPQ
jgi:hypothetical protein